MAQDDDPTFKGTHPGLATRLIVAGAGISATYTLPTRGELLIGRSSSAQVSIADASVSRRHALLRIVASGWTLEDLGSANGTAVNDAPLESGKPVPVRLGDVIQVGDVAILVRGPQAAKKEAPPPVDEAPRSLADLLHEIEPLARHYVQLFAREIGRKKEPALSKEALAHLRRHAWPGNVNELRNVIQRAVLLAGEGPIEPEHLPSFETAPLDAESDLTKTHRSHGDLEQKRIQAALEECAGNQTRAAKLLGISRRSLVMKLTKYGMPRPRKRDDET